MAIIHFINRQKSQTKAGLKFLLDYTMREDKTMFNGKRLITGINCNPGCAYTQFRNTKLLYGKESGRQYYHFVQSFSPEDHVSPELAHSIALRFIAETEKFKGFEVVAATHCDRDHIHTHFVMNSVNAETGLKFHIKQDEIGMLMESSDKVVSEYGLSICGPVRNKNDNGNKKSDSRTNTHISDREYRAMDKRESWKLQLAVAIDSCMKTAMSKRHFIWLMEQEGYRVRWTDARKNITYTCPDGSRCRDDKLHEEKYMKENMEYEFRIRQEIVGGIQAGDSGSHESGGTGRAVGDIDRAELQGSDRSDGQAERVAFDSVSGAGKADDGGGYEDRDADSDGRTDEDVPESVDRYADYFIVNEGGEREYVHTGWEDERGSLTVSGRAEEAYDKIYDEAVADFDDGKLDMLIDGAYLAAGVMSLIDEDEVVEDSTQIPSADSRRRKEEKMKQYGIAPMM